MNAIPRRLITATRDLLHANRPDGAPEDIPIRAEWETEKLPRPHLVISADDNGAPHPHCRRLTLILTTQRHADDPATAPPEELHQLFVNTLETHLADLATALAALQLRILKITPTDISEEITDGRGESSTAAWSCHLLILDPGD